MTIPVECFTLLVPIHQVVKVLGWRQALEILRDREHDDFLLSFKAMNQIDIQLEMNRWSGLGLKQSSGSGKARKWKDLCVISRCEEPTFPCDWVRFDKEAGEAEWIPEKDRPKKTGFPKNK